MEDGEQYEIWRYSTKEGRNKTVYNYYLESQKSKEILKLMMIGLKVIKTLRHFMCCLKMIV